MQRGKKIPGYIEKITEQFTVKEKLSELEKCCLVSYPLVKWQQTQLSLPIPMLVNLNLAPVLRVLAYVEAELNIILGAYVTWDGLSRKRNVNRHTISICQNVPGTLQPNSVNLSFCLEELCSITSHWLWIIQKKKQNCSPVFC